jgi:hypothetical protein
LLLEPFLLALVVVSGSILVYRHLPKKIRKLIRALGGLVSISALVGVYYYCGRNLQALMAGLMTSVKIFALIYAANHPDELLFLYDLRDMIKKEMEFLISEVRRIAREYREGHKKPGYLVNQLIPQSFP